MYAVNTSAPSGFAFQENGRADKNTELLRQRLTEGLQKVKTFSFIQLCLALVLTVCGIATLVVAAEGTIGFPVFNFGPLLTALLMFLAGGFGFHGAREGLSQLPGGVAPSVRCKVRTNFGITVALMSIAALSAVFAFLSGAVCAGADITFYNGRGPNARPIDVEQYCHPKKSANAALAFVDGVLCVLSLVWNMLGLCLFCRYGRPFGIKTRGRVR